jgi:hypothetical protein
MCPLSWPRINSRTPKTKSKTFQAGILRSGVAWLRTQNSLPSAMCEAFRTATKPDQPHCIHLTTVTDGTTSKRS